MTSTRVLASPPALRWALRGGFQSVAVWRPDTGEAVSSRLALAAGVVDETEYQGLGSGGRRPVRRVRGLAVTLAAADAVAVVDRWAAEGAPVCARLVAATTGRHVLWDEAVPAETAVVGPAPASLSGCNLVLHTERFHAAVTHSPDLLARHPFAEPDPLAKAATAAVRARTGWAEDARSGAVLWSRDEYQRPVVRLAGDARVWADVALPCPGLAVLFSADNVEDYDRTGHPRGGPSREGARLRLIPLKADGTFAGKAREERVFGPGVSDVATRLPEGTARVRVVLEGPGTFAAPALTTRRRDGAAIPPHQLTTVTGLKDRPLFDPDLDVLVTTGPASASDADGDGLYDLSVPPSADAGTADDGWFRVVRSDDE